MKLFAMLPGFAAAATMETKTIAPGVEMPKVSIGTWVSGSTSKKEDPKEIVSNWLSLGFRGVDTALVYFDQKDVAETIAESGVAREDIFITSKIPDCSAVATSVDYDLKKLNSSYIDLMLIHGPIGLPGACPKAWKVLEKYVADGKLRAIGVSNFNAKQLQRIVDVATVPIAVNQIQYNVFSHDEDTIAFCDQHNITVEAWSPLNGAHGGQSVFSDDVVLGIAKEHNVSAAQVALRWILQRGHVLTVLTSNKEHQANDADLFSFTLKDEEIATLTAHQKKTLLV
jgi:2,5-diketo-D-gluconate reductase A